MAAIKGIVIGGSAKFDTGNVEVDLPTGLGLLVVRQGAARVSVHLTDESLALLAKGALSGNRAALVTRVLAPAAPAKVVTKAPAKAPTGSADHTARCETRDPFKVKGRCIHPVGHTGNHRYASKGSK